MLNVYIFTGIFQIWRSHCQSLTVLQEVRLTIFESYQNSLGFVVVEKVTVYEKKEQILWFYCSY